MWRISWRNCQNGLWRNVLTDFLKQFIPGMKFCRCSHVESLSNSPGAFGAFYFTQVYIMFQSKIQRTFWRASHLRFLVNSESASISLTNKDILVFSLRQYFDVVEIVLSIQIKDKKIHFHFRTVDSRLNYGEFIEVLSPVNNSYIKIISGLLSSTPFDTACVKTELLPIHIYSLATPSDEKSQLFSALR